MSTPSICVVVPTCRPELFAEFQAAWDSLFRKHRVTLVAVHDGERPTVEAVVYGPDALHAPPVPASEASYAAYSDLVCRRTDAVRNLGFLYAARLRPDVVITLDDDVRPLPDYHPRCDVSSDPIAEHLDVLGKKVSTSWMNTANPIASPYLRGVPYTVRDEAVVTVSHGVWEGVPDFDGRTQLELEKANLLPSRLPYYRGVVPAGVKFPVCGMNLAVTAAALPYLYFAPMGPDSGVPGLHRFSDIWMGLILKAAVEKDGGALYTGASIVLHARASDAAQNADREALGIAWHEHLAGRARQVPPGLVEYTRRWLDCRTAFGNEIRRLQGA